MKLSEILKNYRIDENLSLRQFADRCELSHVSITNLEKEVTSNGTKTAPSLATLQKLARGMRMSVEELISSADDLPFSLKKDYIERQKLWSLMEQLTPENRAAIIQLIKSMTQ